MLGDPVDLGPDGKQAWADDESREFAFAGHESQRGVDYRVGER
jgi:hypothetical protein